MTYPWRLLLLGFVLSSPLEAQLTVTVGGNSSPPYRNFEGREPSGLYVDIFRLAAKKLGWSVKFQELPMARALLQMEAGDIDVMLGPNRTPEREKFMVFVTEVPFPRERKVLFIPSDAPDIRNQEELKGKTVGVLRGAVYSPEFDQDTGIKKYELGDYTQGLQMTAAGRLSGVIIPERQGETLLTLHPLPLKQAGFVLEGAASYIAFSWKSPLIPLIPNLTSVLKELSGSSEYREILKKYGY